MAGNFGGDSDDVVSGINVTPLVDVVLVLLVIFLITAPVIYQNALKVQLPQAKSGEESKPNPLAFVLTKEGDLVWNNQKVSWDDLPAKLSEFTKSSAPEGATVSADKATPHGIVVRLMDILRQNGILKFSLTVESGGGK